MGIGECGLDYYRATRDPSSSPALAGHYGAGMRQATWKKQKNALELQIVLAREVSKPLMIHCRDAFGDLIDILVACRMSLVARPGVIHFFSGIKDDARALSDLGFSFSFGGVITFTRDYDEVVKYIPLDRILLETDAPYVTPVPYRGKRNEPAYVVEVAKKMAEVRGVSSEEIATQTFANTKRFLDA